MMLLGWLVAGLLTGVVVERVVGVRQGRRRSFRRIFAWASLAMVFLLIVGMVGGYLWAKATFDKIDKVDVSAHLSHGSSGTNFLLVGSDNGSAENEQREGVEGARSDTIMVLNVDGGRARMLSLNRDLWVTNPVTGGEGRLNATYNAGPANLVAAVTTNFGIPIDRYIEIDFVSFGSLVDSFGGIDVEFAHPSLDRGSGLVVEQPGLVHLDGDQALAFVRSRHFTEVIDGREVPEGGLPDLNRTARQQVFLREIMKKGGSKRNPFTLMSAAGKMTDGLRIDDDMSMFDAGRFAWSMGRLDPETVVLPVIPRITSGGAAVLDLGDGAEEILAGFR